jgi:hypothetical protein
VLNEGLANYASREEQALLVARVEELAMVLMLRSLPQHRQTRCAYLLELWCQDISAFPHG